MDRQAGVSLVEILVAAFVLSIVATIAVALMATTMTAQEANEAALARAADLDRLRVILREDFGQVALRPSRDEAGFSRRYIFAGDTEGLRIVGETEERGRILAFARHGRANPGYIRARSSLVFVEYLVRDNALIRRTREYPDLSSETLMVEQVLLQDIENLELSFWVGANWRADYILTLDAETRILPPAMRLRYQLTGAREIEHIVLSAEGFAP